MIICVCQNISERDIARAVAGGCTSFMKLQEQYPVGASCGTCECAARECFAEQQAARRASQSMPVMPAVLAAAL
jgi:bacterioferritin-associated ferredoxin